MDSKKARALLADAELIHSVATIQTALDEVAARIHRQLAERNPLVLCVMTGGVVFCGQLLPKLDFPLDFDYLHATRYGPETQGGKISWRSAPWIPVKDRTVLVVDDILDEGVTLAAVKENHAHDESTTVPQASGGGDRRVHDRAEARARRNGLYRSERPID